MSEGQNGKGDKSRVTNFTQYQETLGQISSYKNRWEREEEAKKEEEDKKKKTSENLPKED